MFEDEAGFGRINKPKYCWCNNNIRPSVACHHIREYRYAFGSVDPLTGESFFLVLPNCNTENMNVFLKEVSEYFCNDILILVCDGAMWHKSKRLNAVVDKLCDTINLLTGDLIKSITCRPWIKHCFIRY